MNNMNNKKIISIAIIVFMIIALSGCVDNPSKPISDSGVSKTSVNVQTQPNGLTIEQQNVKDRIALDNKPGSIKHLYVISSYSGQVLIYSTVKGKVTSSGKRLTPYTVSSGSGQSCCYAMPIDIGGGSYHTNEVLEDDGTYGSSMPYLYWWDTKGVYHQMYITGGEIVQISDQPLAVKEVIMNFELTNESR
jgi:hypothetical protein